MTGITVAQICSNPEITPEEFLILLCDRTFLDFFNVFLSLPCFSQKILCIFGEYDFIVGDPATVKQKKYDKGKIGEWLLRHRIPLFLSSKLCLDMKLACELLDLTVHVNDGSLFSCDDGNKATKVKKFVRSQVGHALGMCQLRSHMQDTAGEWILEFWKDVEILRCLPVSTSCSQRALKVRQIQIKYFSVEENMSPIRKAWNEILDFTNQIRKEVSMAKSWYILGEVTDIKPFETLQKLLMELFREYWLPRFIVHRQMVLVKMGNYDPGYDSDAETSLSELSISELTKNIDKTLNKLRSSTGCESFWTDAFSQSTESKITPVDDVQAAVDDSFLNSRDKVIVQHTVDLTSTLKLGSKGLEKELGQYDSSQPVSPSNVYLWSEDAENIGKETSIKSLVSEEVLTATSSKTGSVGDLDQEDAESVSSSLYNQWLNYAGAGSPTSVFNAFNLPGGSHASPDNLTKSGLFEGSRESSQTLPKIDSPNRRFPNAGSPLFSKNAKLDRLPPMLAKHQETTTPNPGTYLYGFPLPNIRIEEYQKSNMSENSFRSRYQHMLHSLLADSFCGKPFEKFLLAIDDSSSLACLHLYEDIVHQITLVVSTDLRIAKAVDWNHLGHMAKLFLSDYRLQHRNAQLVISRYLLATSSERVELPPLLRRTLIAHLLQGDAQEALLQTQEFLVRHLYPVMKNFQREDRLMFNKCMFPDDKTSPGFEWLQMGQMPGSPKKNKKVLKTGILKHRAQRALQLAAHLNNCDISHCLLESFSLENVVFDRNSEEGSLHIETPFVVKTRRDLMEEKKRMKELIKIRWNKYQDKIKEVEFLEQLAQLDDLKLPEYARPIESDGIRLQRPLQPRTFSDILRNPTQLKFFHQYLAVVHNETESVSFWSEVEGVKAIRDQRIRQAMVDKIFRKYFKDQNRFQAICNQEEMMREIQKKNRVTLQILTSAQAFIAGLLEALWFKQYQITFLPPETSESAATGQQVAKIRPKRKTKPLWIAIIRAMKHFVKGLLNPDVVRDFKKFLRSEVEQEIERQKSSGNSAVGWQVPIKKSLYNKYLDMTKLINDVDFLAEQERFRRLCDSLQMAAGVGLFKPSEHDILITKAGTIIRCYIDSDINPKIQINISSETAEKILEDFRKGILGRALFHDASMSVCGVIMQLWKKYKTWKTQEMSKPQVPVVSRMEMEMPDYLNIEDRHIKRMKASSDSELLLRFSLSLGLRWFVPSKGRTKNAFPLLTGNVAKLLDAFDPEQPYSKHHRRLSKMNDTPPESTFEEDSNASSPPVASDSKTSN